MNTRFAREHTMIAPAQLLRNWREQRPSNQSDFDSIVTWAVGSVCYTGVDLLLVSFLYRSVIVVGVFRDAYMVCTFLSQFLVCSGRNTPPLRSQFVLQTATL
jgi:hypothetical protein